MDYIKQGEEPNCGAFAVAYYKWEKDGVVGEECPQMQVNAIYNAIKFPETYSIPGLQNYSNPVKIMNYLEVNNPVFHYDPDISVIKNLIDLMKEGSEGGTILTWESATPKKVINIAPAFTGNGYLISLCYQIKLGDSPGSQLNKSERVHYTLIRHDSAAAAAERYKMLNSWDGVYKTLTEDFISGTGTVPSGSGGDSLKYLKAGIWIPD